VSLKHALLGFLNYSPMTGYELKKFFDASVAHFWNAELSQIYPTLKGLESEGLVEMNVEAQEDRPNRKVYSLTDDGREELVTWLGQPAEPNQIREPILIKVFFAAAISKDEIVSVLEKRIADLKEAIQQLDLSCRFSAQAATALHLPVEGFFWGLTPELGIKVCEAEMEWAHETIEKIGTVDLPSPKDDHAGGSFDARAAAELLDQVKRAMGPIKC
jgi:PadR family transcriptional regulator AphA